MKLITESVLFVLLFSCCCCLTVNAICWVECPKSQRNLSEPECFLKDDGSSDTCSLSISNSDLTGQSISGYNFLSLSIDLNSIIQNLSIHNRIKNHLKVGTFRFHSEITKLEIRLTYIHTELFEFLPNLRDLILYQIQFRYFPPFSHSNPFLTSLKIYDSSFTFPGSDNNVVRKNSVSDLSQLKYLYLYSNQFMNLTDESFSGLTALTFLLLIRFYIPDPIATFSPLVRLNELHYQYSELTDIAFLKQTFSLYGLKYLSLRNNLVTSIQSNTFSRYNDLTGLDLNYNEITRLENKCLKGLERVIDLHLQSNQLIELNATTFKGLESLTYIGLENNYISHLSSRIFESLPKLFYIKLYSLPLHCDCGLKWMSIVDLKIIYSLCATPLQHSSKPATDPSIYVNCTQELSYQCFNRSNSCPTGSYCQDTFDSYTCVCEEEHFYFVKYLNKCVRHESCML